MSDFLPGSVPIHSTGAMVTDPSTTTICAYVTSSGASSLAGMGAQHSPIDVLAHVYLGSSHIAVPWWLEQATSTSIAAGAIVSRIPLHTSSGNTHQYVARFRMAATDLLRVRVESSFSGTASAKIIAEVIG